MLSMWVRMFEWAIGDGMLGEKYPALTFLAPPTVPEALLLTAAAPLLLLPELVSGHAATVVSILLAFPAFVSLVLLADFAAQFVWFYVVLPRFAPQAVPEGAQEVVLSRMRQTIGQRIRRHGLDRAPGYPGFSDQLL